MYIRIQIKLIFKWNISGSEQIDLLWGRFFPLVWPPWGKFFFLFLRGGSAQKRFARQWKPAALLLQIIMKPVIILKWCVQINTDKFFSSVFHRVIRSCTWCSCPPFQPAFGLRQKVWGHKVERSTLNRYSRSITNAVLWFATLLTVYFVSSVAVCPC